MLDSANAAQTANDTPLPVDETWNDAAVIGDFDAPEMQDILSRPWTMLQAPTHDTAGKRWQLVETTIEEAIEHLLSLHPVEVAKHGHAITYARGRTKGTHTGVDGVKVRHASRRKVDIEAMTAVAIDVDGGDTVENLAARIRDLGWLAIVFTTHSHTTKGAPGSDRFRIVLPLAEPFELPMEDRGKRAAAENRWKAHYAGVCEALGLDKVDASGFSLNQIQHPPRRPSKAAPYKHLVIVGALLDLATVADGDLKKYRVKHARSGGKALSSVDDGAPALLDDGVDLRQWYRDVGRHLDVEVFLDDLGWQVHGGFEGVSIQCPNAAQHSDPDDPDDRGCWACGEYGDEVRMVISCRHDHCGHLHTWDFVRLLAEHVQTGAACLPDEYETVTDLLADPAYYPATVEEDGEEIEIEIDPANWGRVERVEIVPLGTKGRVQRAYARLKADGRAGRDAFAALWAGVERAGDKAAAVDALMELMRADKGANEARSLRKRGSELLRGERDRHAAESATERRRQAESALDRDDLAHPSMDVADPVGDTMAEALATLSKRFALVDIEGRFRAVRRPDLDALRGPGAVLKSAIVSYSIGDLRALHKDRMIEIRTGDGVDHRNPVDDFVDVEKRKSSIVFAPPPASARVSANAFNMYQGRTLQPAEGDTTRLHSFLREVVCSNREGLYRWVRLWLAHLVQRPGQKMGTAIVLHGKGGCGKSTFGEILKRLADPHGRVFEQAEHITGRFAGEHLSTCIVAICAESAFAGDPRVSGVLKSLITAPNMVVEPKGLPLFEVPNYTRLFFDSNDRHAVQIEGNGSERRFLVMEINPIHYGNKPYWTDVYADLNGPAMGALLAELMAYDPADDGMTWDDLRVAPSTPERDAMGYQSLRPSGRLMLDLIREGAFTFVAGDDVETIALEEDMPTRLPRSRVRALLSGRGSGLRADDSDPVAILHHLFGERVPNVDGVDGADPDGTWPTVKEARGSIIPGDKQDVRWVEVPPRKVLAAAIKARFHFEDAPKVADAPAAEAK